VERELLLTGIGGQGVQLGAQVLARAAVHEGRHVLLLGVYGGTMRGGTTDATLVFGDAPIESPPIVSRSWSALAMHPAHFEPVRRKLLPDAVVVLNASLFEAEMDRASHRFFEVAATRIATELGAPLAASLVLVAAYAGLTGVVGIDALVEAMQGSVPAYRRQHLETNERALRAGYASVPRNAAPAFAGEEAA
jgi:Pyruvate/2-oxoacid:ferredoxin oxidoreductase gamma subunit